MLPALLAVSLTAQVEIRAGKTQADVSIGGKPFTTLYFGPDTTKPYLHPLRTAGGKIVTRRYPMENVEGEQRDHPHHRGLWFSHGDVNGWDFWANEKNQKGVGKGGGQIVFTRLKSAKGGKKSGAIEASFEWKDGQATALLTDERRITFHGDDRLRIIDYDLTLKALVEAKFGDTKEGVFAMRLARELEELKTGTMTSASGAKKEKAVWGSAAPWVDYAGTLEGEAVGIAIFDHPKNPRHPTYWHARGYGLFASNIFGVRDFTRDKAKDGSLTLKPGETLQFRFRVVIHPGDTAQADVAKMYQSWTKK
jgi:hypothetical protein